MRDPFDPVIDAEVSYAGIWHSVNDTFNFELTPEGFGMTEQTFRRTTVTSDFFEGDYQVRAVRASVKRTWEIKVNGVDQLDLQNNIDKLVGRYGWFLQDTYQLRYRVNEYQETWLCDTADYSIDQTHVNLHNLLAKVRLSFSTQPTVVQEVIL